MSKMSVEEKAATYSVEPSADPPGFVVKSPTGSTHLVRLDIEGAPSSARCDCTWAINRPGGKPCSHLLAVRKFAEKILISDECRDGYHSACPSHLVRCSCSCHIVAISEDTEF